MKKLLKENLLKWFRQNQRPWPWRKTKDPYAIWISEVMLQQTTSAAVKPFFERFLGRFPDVKSLAKAPVEDVLEHWSGLGYYSRARNLHKSAQALASLDQFPKSHLELLELPGFGPYTARSVTSLAFENPVGVLDGNVIRVMSRFLNRGFQWWTTQDRKTLQATVDHWVDGVASSQMNQALMELGATICLPANPKCLICPVAEDCKGLKNQTQTSLPLQREKRQKEIWLWQVQVENWDDQVKFVKNDYAPFLKNQWFLPGTAKKLSLKPKKYSFKHTITHHEIYVHVSTKKVRISNSTNRAKLNKGQEPSEIWIERKNSKKLQPANLVQKTLHLLDSAP